MKIVGMQYESLFLNRYKTIFDEYNTIEKTIKNNVDYSEIQYSLDKVIRLKNKEDLDFLLSDSEKLLEACQKGTNQVKAIVEGLRAYSRIDNSKEAFDLNYIVEQTINVIWNELKYHCTLDKNLGDIPQIFGYPGQWIQVIRNLVQNAADSIQNKGEISITTYSDSRYIYIEISDNGSGISKDNLDKIFDPFFTTKPAGKGTGLGLSIVYGIIENHNGKINVDSKKGGGTTFTIQVPVGDLLTNSKNIPLS